MSFLNTEEQEEIIEAIAIAEKNTSGEIKVHIETQSEKPPLERAQEVFLMLNIHQTKERNGVLIYVCLQSKSLAIVGDEGINKVVETDFWESTKDLMLNHFKKQAFKDGLVEGILKAGEQLKVYFPYTSDDINEISNEISTS